ncbi:MAG: hypothetical protein OEU32_17770, partial [Acidimicrobiia bacterium]|nr:hypothetical protein [Acidimicrobiia bacterium]
MPENLRVRATTQLDLFAARHQDLAAALAAARNDLDAMRDVDAGRDALALVQDQQRTVREKLGAVANPADADTFEAELRALLVEEAGLRVDLRHAEERVAEAQRAVETLGALVEQAAAGLRAAEDRLVWATTYQELLDGLRAAIAAPPLDTIVADAVDMLGSAEHTAADVRLDDLLPAQLRARAIAREREAADHSGDAVAHLIAAEQAADALAIDGAPLTAAVMATKRFFLAAVDEVQRYVGGGTNAFERATAVFARTALLPDLTDAQVAALDLAIDDPARAAVDAETALAVVLAQLTSLERAVDDAQLAALIAEPDALPAGDAAVIAAEEALAEPTFQADLLAKRTAYDSAAAAAVDAWEVEVPPAVWSALADFIRSERALNDLADQSARDDMLDLLDSTQDDLAAALTDVDVDIRRRWA